MLPPMNSENFVERNRLAGVAERIHNKNDQQNEENNQ